jgi:tryptophan 7-halogenase
MVYFAPRFKDCILQYHVNELDDSQFWRDVRNMEIPASSKQKINLFSEAGKIFREQDELFAEVSWLQVMVGQSIMPKDYHPFANSLPDVELIDGMHRLKSAPLSPMPTHDEFLAQVCRR